MATEVSNTLTLACHCRSSTWTFPFDPVTPPQSHTFCHCSACRHRTGALATICFSCPPELTPPQDLLDRLQAHKTYGDQGNVMVFYFCRDCGTHMLSANELGDAQKSSEGSMSTWMSSKWNLAVSALNRAEGLYNVTGHEHLSTTNDGGMANWLLDLGGKRTDLWSESEDRPETEIGELPFLTEEEQRISDRADSLHYHCLCKSTSIYVTLPVRSSSTSLPYWLAPSLGPTDVSGRAGSNDGQSDNGPLRRRAKLCACRDCTTSSGVAYPAAAWVDVPFGDIYADEGLTERWVSDRALGEAKDGLCLDIPGTRRHDSTPGKTARFFCPICGAKILLLSHLNPSVPRLAASLLVTNTTTPTGQTIKHPLLAPMRIAWWAGANVCQSVADMDLEDCSDPELGLTMARGLASWGQAIQSRMTGGVAMLC